MTQAFASKPMRRTALAMCLCLLAVLFALEAKIARYSPSSGPLSAIQSAKARPADGPELVSRGLAAASSAPLQWAFILLAAFATTGLMVAESSGWLRVVPRNHAVTTATYFSPGLFFRPPPELRIL